MNPGPCSTSRIDIPLCAGTAAGSVLHSSAMTCERRAFVIQVFDAVHEVAALVRRATVRIACRSDPPPGSVSAIVARISPVAIFGR